MSKHIDFLSRTELFLGMTRETLKLLSDKMEELELGVGERSSQRARSGTPSTSSTTVDSA